MDNNILWFTANQSEKEKSPTFEGDFF